MPLVSVLLSTFNQPTALKYSLLGYSRQSFQDFEVVVCDDGSDEDTAKVLEEVRKRVRFEIKHVWQENKGYRRAKIVNKGYLLSTGKFLVLSDGDCIPHTDFLRTHVENLGENTFCVGGYVMLPAEYSKEISEEKVLAGDVDRFANWSVRFRHWVRHLVNKYYLAVGRMDRPKVYGSNIGVDRNAYFAVNGYDEGFDGFGKEDSDLRNRLRRYGARAVSVWGKAFVFHLGAEVDNKRKERPAIPRVSGKEYYYRKNVPIRCINGIEKLDSSKES